MTLEQLREAILAELERPDSERSGDDAEDRGYDDALHWVLAQIDGSEYG